MKIYVAHASSFDFKAKLYAPLRTSTLSGEHEILLPQEGPIEEITREMVASADVLVAEVSHPSLGVGIEIGWAHAVGVPVIAMHEASASVSFSIDNAVNERFEYRDSNEMITKLMEVLQHYS